MHRLRHIPVVLALLALACTTARATTIEAEQMVAEQKTHQARFRGAVSLVSDDLHMQSDRLTAYYRDRLGGTLQRVEAHGHVRLQRKEMHGRANHATLDQKRRLLVLSGNAELTEHGRLIQGGRIEHHLDSGNTIVTEGAQGKRVHIHIDDDRKQRLPH